MSESELSIRYSDLLLEVATFLGYSSDPTAWTTEENAALDRHVQAGVRRFYYPPAFEGIQAGYSWSFLNPVTTIDTAIDGGTQDLPAGLGRVLGNFHYEEGDHRRSIVQVGEEKYRKLLSRSESTGGPQVAVVRHKAHTDPAVGQRLEVSWWPVPDAVYTLTYQYEAYSGKLSEQNPFPLGGMRHAELLIESCVAVAEQRENDEKGIRSEEFVRSLRAAIEQDRRLGARYFGHMGSFEAPGDPRSGFARGCTGTNHVVSYKGVDH